MLAEAPPAALVAPAPARIVAGRSAEGRAIVARRRGPADAPVVLLAIGPIHGDEPGAAAPIAALRRARLPPGVAVWTVRVANPDGLARGRRQNARGVDLNRNFPDRWRASGRRGDRFWPGPSAASEPETRVLMRLVQRLRPDLTIHYHQPYGIVVRGSRVDLGLARRYAERSGLPLRALPPYRGTIAGWQNAGDAGSALVVELRAGTVGDRAGERHAAAALAVVRLLIARAS